VALAGGGVYFGLSLAVEPRGIREGLGALGEAGVVLVLSLSLLNYVLRFVRWHAYLRYLGQPLPLLRHCLIYFAGFALTVSPGKAGEALRVLYLHPLGVSYARSFAVLLVERMLDLMAMTLLASLLLASLPGLGSSVAVAALLAVAAAWLLGTSLPARACTRLARCPGLSPRLQALAHGFAGMMHGCAAILRPQLLLPGLVLGILSWGAEGYGLYVLLHSMDLAVTSQQAIGAFAMAALAGAALVFMPGGLGGTEATLTALLLVLAVPLPTAIAATLLCRMATLWFAVALGIAAVAVLELRGIPHDTEVTR
jgi:uncharacterized protein (TIRG00374 family)